MKILLSIIVTVCFGVLLSLIVYSLGFRGYNAGYFVGLSVGIISMVVQQIFKVK